MQIQLYNNEDTSTYRIVVFSRFPENRPRQVVLECETALP